MERTLQQIHNAAAHILTRTSIRDHISPILASLHWHPVPSRIEFKVLVLTNNVVQNQAASYPKEFIVLSNPCRISKIRRGVRAFSYKVALLWKHVLVLV